MIEDNEVMDLNIDINSLTVGEIEAVEELSGSSIDQLFSANGRKGKALRAIAYITKRRENPDFTWEDAGNLRINLTAPEENPTPPEE